MVIFLFIFCLLLVIYAFLINYYRRAWNQIPDFTVDRGVPDTFISVIIPARNEAKNIPGLLKSLAQQTYPATLHEILIIDDHSTDETWNVLKSFSQNSVNVKPLKLADLLLDTIQIQSHKKLAIEKGIAIARGQLIVTTDADCIFDPDWLAVISDFYQATQAKFIAAPVKMNTNARFLSIFQSLDFITLQGITGASVHTRFHTMCNGANLAYEKEAFAEVGGFAGVDKIPSGDDMFLMHKIYRRYPDRVFYLKAKQAIVLTDTIATWKEFFNQRIRWASKATYYDDKRIFWILLLVYIVNLFFLVLAITCFWDVRRLIYFLLLLIIKTSIEFSFVKAVTEFFGERKILRYFPILQPLHILYTIIAGWLGKFGSYEWKGRRIKQ